MLNPLLVFLGGLLGTLARWLLIEASPATATFAGAEWGLLLSNVLGAGLLGFLGKILLPGSRGSLLFGTGFCGAFTSYSALAGVAELIPDAGLPTVVLYFSASILLGLGAAWLGMRVGRAAAIRREGVAG